MSSIWQDLRYGARQLARNPGFTAVAVLTLALGIGANTAIFSVFNHGFLHSLPFKEENRLVRLYDYSLLPSGERTTFNCSGPDFLAIRDQNTVFEGVVALRADSMNLLEGEAPEHVSVVSASPQWISILGLTKLHGRSFTSEEEQEGSDSSAAMISDRLWKRHFGADLGAVGEKLRLQERTYTVVGVLPPGFHFPYEADVWVPETVNTDIRRPVDYAVFARLRPGVDLAKVNSELETIAARQAQAFPERNQRIGFLAEPARNTFLDTNEEALVLALLGAVGFLLLIVSANVTSLLLARLLNRQKEAAVRAALGASRGRLLRQFVTESVLLFLLGGAAGLLLTLWLRDYLHVLIPRVLRSELAMGRLELDFRVLGFTLGVSVLCGAFCGALASLRAVGPSSFALLKGGIGISDSRTSRRLLQALVVSEIALTLVLLVGAGMMVLQFQRLQHAELGFATRNLLTLRAALPEARYASGSQRVNLVRQALEVIERLPGVTSAAITTVNPLGGGTWGARVTLEGHEADSSQADLIVHHRLVSPGFFRTMGIPLRQGRYFSDQDNETSQPVVIVDERMAQHYWPGESALGKRIKRGRPDSPYPWLTIIGVVGPIKDIGDYHDTWYLPYQQNPLAPSAETLHLMVRTTRDPLTLSRPAGRALWTLDSHLAVSEVTPMDRYYAATLSGERLSAMIFTIFASSGLLLAGLGLFGLMSYVVGQRTREIGIRRALGARPESILRMVLAQGMALAALGISVGLSAALVLTRVLRGQLFGVTDIGGLTYAVVSLLLAGVALLASYLPARRAMRVDPMTALRYE